MIRVKVWAHFKLGWSLFCLTSRMHFLVRAISIFIKQSGIGRWRCVYRVVANLNDKAVPNPLFSKQSDTTRWRPSTRGRESIPVTFTLGWAKWSHPLSNSRIMMDGQMWDISATTESIHTGKSFAIALVEYTQKYLGQYWCQQSSGHFWTFSEVTLKLWHYSC